MSETMLSPTSVLALYCLLVVFASLAGGWLPLIVKLTHLRLQLATSLVAGLMLGIALLHFLPHAAEESGSLHSTVLWMLGGFVGMFFLQRFFHFHHHDLPEGDPDDCTGHDHEHDHRHGHEHDHEPHGLTLAAKSAKQLSWIGTAIGLTLHSLLDGLALAAAVATGAHDIGGGLVGFGVALAVILHKPFDALAVGTLMAAGGKSKWLRHLLNLLFALATPLGVVLFHVGAAQFAEANHAFLGAALALCAGTFLCIACSDLLPELQFHSHDPFKLSVAFVLGLGVAVFIGGLKHDHSSHDHDHAPALEAPGAQDHHSHEGHSH